MSRKLTVNWSEFYKRNSPEIIDNELFDEKYLELGKLVSEYEQKIMSHHNGKNIRIALIFGMISGIFIGIGLIKVLNIL